MEYCSFVVCQHLKFLISTKLINGLSYAAGPLSSAVRQKGRLSVRVAIPGIWIGCPGGGKSPSDVNSGGKPLLDLIAETSDMVLVLNETEGAMAGCPAILAGNLLLQAVQIRVHGPGKHRINDMHDMQRQFSS